VLANTMPIHENYEFTNVNAVPSRFVVSPFIGV